MMKLKPTIALVPSSGMGDGLLQLLWARIFRENGYRVICYQNFLAQLADYLDGFEVRPLAALYEPPIGDRPDAVWYDVGSGFEPQRTEFSRQLLHFPYCLSRSWKPDSDIRSPYEGSDPLLLQMRSAPYNVYNRKPKGRILQDIRWFCRNYLGLEVLPAHGSPMRGECFGPVDTASRRVLIHPLSSNPIKNWHMAGFIALADQLKEKGWIPVFTFSPEEEGQVVPQLEGRHQWLLCENLAELVDGYRSCCALIGNDSGNGHLASALGLPVLTILNTPKRDYRWRPCWTANRLLSGWLPFKFSNDGWHRSLPVSRLVRAFEALMHTPKRYSSHVDHVNLKNSRESGFDG